MTRAEARKLARQLLRAGFKHPEVVEDVETGEVRVQAFNRCWNLRRAETVAEGQELLRTEGSQRG